MKDAALRVPGVARLDAGRHATRSGLMHDPEYVVTILAGHIRRLQKHGGLVRGIKALDLGPGNSLGQAFLLCLLGADRVVALDVRRYATAETGRGVYERIVQGLERWIETGTLTVVPAGDTWRSRAKDLLPAGESFPRLDDSLSYRITDGRSMPVSENSLDFVYSCAVLEHVPDAELTYNELSRVLRPGGLMSHIIDLKDHHHHDPYDFLRYGDKLWSLMQGRSAGFTNRLRASDHIGLIREAGFEILDTERRMADAPPARSDLAPRFRAHQDDDLRIMELIVTARRREDRA